MLAAPTRSRRTDVRAAADAKPPKLSERVLAFFRENPDEELTAGDIATKWGHPEDDVPSALRWHVSHAYLKRDDGDDTYRAGVALLEQIRTGQTMEPAKAALVAARARATGAQPDTPAAAAAPAPDAPASTATPQASPARTARRGAKPAAASARKLPPLDLKKVVIRTGVPLPAREPRDTSAYIQLLQKLQPNEMAEVDAMYRGSLTKVARSLRDKAPQRYAFRDLGNGKFGVWRTA